MKDKTKDLILFVLTGFFLGIFLGIFIHPDISLSQEVADDVCIQLTGNQSAIATQTDADLSFWKRQGKLVCIIPSFDSTQNIIIKTNEI